MCWLEFKVLGLCAAFRFEFVFVDPKLRSANMEGLRDLFVTAHPYSYIPMNPAKSNMASFTNKFGTC